MVQSPAPSSYQLIPKSFSLDAYKMLFRIPGELLQAYGVSWSVSRERVT